MCNVSQADVQNYTDAVIFGRVLFYDAIRGYGFARTSFGKDVFLSSYNVSEPKVEHLLVVGALIKFTLGYFNGRACAKGIVVVEQYPNGVTKIDLPNGEKLPIRFIKRYGRANLLTSPKQLKAVMEKEHLPEKPLENGFKYNDFDVVYIDVGADSAYRFVRKDSQLTLSGKTDIEKFYAYLKRTLCSF